MGQVLPSPFDPYDGDIASLSESITELKKMSAYRLWETLRFHNILDCGTKDELALRVGVLKANRSYLAFHIELEAVINLITATCILNTITKGPVLRRP